MGDKHCGEPALQQGHSCSSRQQGNLCSSSQRSQQLLKAAQKSAPSSQRPQQLPKAEISSKIPKVACPYQRHFQGRTGKSPSSSPPHPVLSQRLSLGGESSSTPPAWGLFQLGFPSLCGPAPSPATIPRGVEQSSSQGNKSFQCLPPRSPFSFPAKLLSPQAISAAVGTQFCLCSGAGKGECAAGDRGDTSTAGPNPALCQQPLPQGTSTAGQNSRTLHSTGNWVLHPHRGSSQLSSPEWVGMMVFNPSVSGNGWDGEFGCAASHIQPSIKANQGCAGSGE